MVEEFKLIDALIHIQLVVHVYVSSSTLITWPNASHKDMDSCSESAQCHAEGLIFQMVYSICLIVTDLTQRSGV